MRYIYLLYAIKMTDTRATVETQAIDNYETIIFFAGMMMHLIKSGNELSTFESSQAVMTPEMRNILFPLISYRVSMKRQKILGVVPVLEPYHRLHPLFYRLSQTEDLYYTTEDTLLRMRQGKQHVPEEVKDLLTRQKDEINRQAGRISKAKGQNTEYEALRREYEVRQAETRRYVFSEGTLNPISHRVLTNLTTEQRRVMLSLSVVRDSILAVFKTFNEHFAMGISRDKLETGITPIDANVQPPYNYDMSMQGTLERVINHTIDYSSEFSKLETLKQRMRRNPHDKNTAKQYAELSREIGSPNPFRNLLRSFDNDNDALDKLSRREATEEERQEARDKLTEYMNRYASIAEKTLSEVQQTALDSREKSAIFVESDQ